MLHLVHQKTPFCHCESRISAFHFSIFNFLTNKQSSAFKWVSLHLVCFILSFGFLTICCRAASNRLWNKQNIVSLNIVLWRTYTHLYSCIISYWSRHDGTLQSCFSVVRRVSLPAVNDWSHPTAPTYLAGTLLLHPKMYLLLIIGIKELQKGDGQQVFSTPACTYQGLPSQQIN